MKKIIAFHLNFSNRKNLFVFYVIVTLTLIFLILGITLTIVDYNTYQNFVNLNISIETAADEQALVTLQNQLNNFDIAMFIYGTFFISLTIIMICICALFGNSTFNHKIKT